jgi:hypothetical protein
VWHCSPCGIKHLKTPTGTEYKLSLCEWNNRIRLVKADIFTDFCKLIFT